MQVKEALARAAGQVAAGYLEDHGFRILDRDWQHDGHTVTIIAADRATLVAIDLQVRTGTGHGTPLGEVPPPRQQAIRQAVTRWLAGHRTRYDRVRIDVIGLQLDRGGFTIEHVRAAG